MGFYSGVRVPHSFNHPFVDDPVAQIRQTLRQHHIHTAINFPRYESHWATTSGDPPTESNTVGVHTFPAAGSSRIYDLLSIFTGGVFRLKELRFKYQVLLTSDYTLYWRLYYKTQPDTLSAVPNVGMGRHSGTTGDPLPNTLTVSRVFSPPATLPAGLDGRIYILFSSSGMATLSLATSTGTTATGSFTAHRRFAVDLPGASTSPPFPNRLSSRVMDFLPWNPNITFISDSGQWSFKKSKTFSSIGSFR